jgi:hypothetical protein
MENLTKGYPDAWGGPRRGPPASGTQLDPTE